MPEVGAHAVLKGCVGDVGEKEEKKLLGCRKTEIQLSLSSKAVVMMRRFLWWPRILHALLQARA